MSKGPKPKSNEERFWEKVDKSGGPSACWPWTASCSGSGYGTFDVAGASKRAHRVVWEMELGPIPEGMCVMHVCDNPPCCNPAHLRLGTHADNMRDMVAKGRSASTAGDRNGARRRPDRLARGEHHGLRLHPERRARGVTHGKTNLTEDIVRAIRDADPVITQRELAALFGIHQSTVSSIKLRKTWGHI